MHLSEEFYVQAMQSLPILCVDAIIKSKEAKYLLVKRNYEPLKGVYWTPGGRVFRGEKLEDAFRRVMKMELGFVPQNFTSVGFFEDFFEKTRQNVPGGVHTVSLVYLVHASASEFKLDDQSSDWKWCDELPERYSEYTELNRKMIFS